MGQKKSKKTDAEKLVNQMNINLKLKEENERLERVLGRKKQGLKSLSDENVGLSEEIIDLKLEIGRLNFLKSTKEESIDKFQNENHDQFQEIRTLERSIIDLVLIISKAK